MQKTLTAATVVLLLTSCSTNYSGTSTGAAPAAPKKASVDASAPLSTSAAGLAGSAEEEPAGAAPTIYRGTDRQVNMPAVAEPIRFLGEDVSINFEQAPLSEVMHAIMGDILQLDYVVDQPIKGEVTVRTRTPIPRDELFGVLESLLKANNVLMIRGSDGRYLVTGEANGATLSPRVSSPHSKGPGFGTMIVPLQYISASNMAEILQPVADPKAFVRVDNARNLLMLAGTGAQLDGWLEMVSTFDVDMLAGMSVGIFPLENSSAEEVYQAISALLNGGGGEGGGAGWRLVTTDPGDSHRSPQQYPGGNPPGPLPRYSAEVDRAPGRRVLLGGRYAPLCLPGAEHHRRAPGKAAEQHLLGQHDPAVEPVQQQ